VTSLPPVLLEQLLSELSTLASVYHRPPESFVGKGRYGAEAIQRAAILEQRQNLAENPIAASVAAAAAGTNGTSQNNIENLLDIDFDGAAPASAEQGTPDRVASPVSAGAAPSGGMADIMGLFDAPAAPGPGAGVAPVGAGSSAGFGGVGSGMNDLMSGFAGMDMSGTSAPPPPGQQLGHGKPGEQSKGNDDLLGLL
jgi:hypothetical protein